MPRRTTSAGDGTSMAYARVVVLALAVMGITLGSNLAGDYVTLDGDRLILAGNGTISVAAKKSSGGYDLCTSARQPGTSMDRPAPNLQTALDVVCPTPADVRRAGVVRPSFYLHYYSAGRATARDRFAVYALAAAQILAILGGSFAFSQVLRRTATGVFAEGSAGWLRLSALAVAVGAVVVPLLIHWFEGAIVDRFSVRPAGDIEPVGSAPGVAPYVVVAMLLVLTHVWQRGIRLRQDAEATI